jgi:hypothetical protein
MNCRWTFSLRKLFVQISISFTLTKTYGHQILALVPHLDIVTPPMPLFEGRIRVKTARDIIFE